MRPGGRRRRGRIERMQPTPLPPELAGRAFAVAESAQAGVSSKRLRARDLTTPFPGVRAPADAPSQTVAERCALLLPRLETHQFFSHTTAAGLHGSPLPAWCGGEVLHVGALPPGREPRIAGVAGHRIALSADDLTMVGPFPVPSPAQSFGQLGALLRWEDLVCVADHLLHAGLASREELAGVADTPRRRGALVLREALAAAREDAESPQETRTRLALVDAGLPEPVLNWTLLTGSGRFVARLDMAYPRYRVCVEYDGRHHAEAAQFARDADRWAELEAEGWILVRVLSHHLREPRRLIIPRVARALRSRGWQPR